MNAIIHPIMPSITKAAEGFVVCFNNTKELIGLSRMELQLQFRQKNAIISEKIITEKMQQQWQNNPNQDDRLQPIITISQEEKHKEIYKEENYTLQFLTPQQFEQFNKINCQNINSSEAAAESQESHLVSKCSTPKFDDITDFQRQPLQEKGNIATSKKKKNAQPKLFTFKKEDSTYKNKIKRLSYEKYPLKEKPKSFTVSIPKCGQSFVTNFEQLGFTKKLSSLTISDFLHKILNYYSQSIKVYQCNSDLGLNIALEMKQPLKDLVILKGTEFKIIDIASDRVQGMETVAFEFGNIEFQISNGIDYKNYCQFTQDCAEIDESILKFVERITFYNFGTSSKQASAMKQLNFNEFFKWTQCWCVQNNFDILHIGTHLTVRLL